MGGFFMCIYLEIEYLLFHLFNVHDGLLLHLVSVASRRRYREEVVGYRSFRCGKSKHRGIPYIEISETPTLRTQHLDLKDPPQCPVKFSRKSKPDLTDISMRSRG